MFLKQTPAGIEAPATRPGTLRVFVLDLPGQDTMAAIRAAGRLARGLGAEVTLVGSVEVPIALPLDQPDVAIPFLEERLRGMVLHGGCAGRVELRLCRERMEGIRQALPRDAMVMLSARRGWFGRSARRVGQALAQDGHRVFYVGGIAQS